MKNNLDDIYSVLLIDDDDTLSSLTAQALECFEFRVRTALNAAKAYEEIKSKMPSLILLDLNMPDISGHEVCQSLRKNLKLTIPILILSGNKDESDVIRSLDEGADDFISKSASFDILLARMRAVLRRSHAAKNIPNGNVISWGNLNYNKENCRATIDDASLELTPSELKLLEIFISAPGTVFTRTKLIENLHGTGHHLTERTMDVHINGLRSKLGALRYALETVRIVGYRFAEKPL